MLLLNHSINMAHIRNEYLVADSINEFDMAICNRLHQRVRTMSDMSDLSDDVVTTQIKQVKEEEEEDNCCICYETLNLKKNYCVTPCGHAFCFICIVKTMAKQNSCPCCRASLYQEEHIQSVVIEEYDDQSVMNESLSSNLMIEQIHWTEFNYQRAFTSSRRDLPQLYFPNSSGDRRSPEELDNVRVNLQNEFDNVANANDTLLSESSDNEMEISTDVSVELPTYISQDSQEDVLEQWPPFTENERNLWSEGRSPSTEVGPDSLETAEPSEEIETADILPSSMDNNPKFGNNSIFMIHSRMRQEGYTMLDVLIITLLMMFPQEIREDLQTYQCAQGLKTIIQDVQNETKEKMLFAMEDRNVM